MRHRTSRRPRRQWFLTLMSVGLVAIVLIAQFWRWPWYLTWYAVWTMVAFLLFGYDKFRARSQGSRVPEVILHLAGWLGGAAGALAGMFLWRHKTLHLTFWWSMTGALIAHAVLLSWGLM